MPARDLTEKVKIGLAAAAFLAVLVGFILDRLRVRAKKNEAAREFLEKTPLLRMGKMTFNVRQTFVMGLLIIALFGTLNYDAYGVHSNVDRYDSYDLLHYYVAPKYFDELGYFRLLPALLVADSENGRYCAKKTKRYLAQDHNDYAFKPLEHALAREKEVKSHFTPERWKAFVHDVDYLQRKNNNLGCRLWRMLLQDHGFNGTPSWVFMAKPIVQKIPVESIKLASSLDLIWIIAMLIAVGWAFGAETALFSWIFVMICYSFRWPIISWSMLRYDWVASMVIGLALLKKEKHMASGAFFGYAALMRYFPALWMFGIVAKGLHSLITRVRAKETLTTKNLWMGVPRKYVRMLVGFVLVGGLLFAASTARFGIESHKTSFENLKAHVQPHNLSSRRMGLAIAAVYRGETEQKLITDEKKQMVADIETPLRIFALLMILVLGVFVSRLKDWEAVGLGLIPFFWLTTSSYYYYALRLTGVVIHAKDLSKTRNVVGLAMLIFMELFSNASEHLNPGNRYFLVSTLCVLMSIYSFTMMAFLGVEWWRSRKAAITEEKVQEQAS